MRPRCDCGCGRIAVVMIFTDNGGYLDLCATDFLKHEAAILKRRYPVVDLLVHSGG